MTADRYNTNKPQLSYIFDFCTSLEKLSIETCLVDTGYLHSILLHLNAFQIRDDDALKFALMETLYILHSQLDGPTIKIVNMSIPTLLTTYSAAWDEIAQVCVNGAIKYKRYNWKQGFPMLDLLDSCYRHLRAYASGEEYDEETREKDGIEYNFRTHHLAHACWNMLVMLEQLTTHLEFDNRYRKDEN